MRFPFPLQIFFPRVLTPGTLFGTCVGLRVGILVGFRTGLRVGLNAGILVGFRAGVRVGLRAGKLVGFRTGVRVGEAYHRQELRRVQFYHLSPREQYKMYQCGIFPNR
jgi:hypothetical protein